LYGVVLGDGTRAWQALLVNFLFFAGLAQAGVVFSALVQATSAGWGRSLKRTAEATAAFLPVAFGLLIVLLVGVSALAPWVREPVAAKTPWLNIPFFVTRQVVAFLLLGGLSLSYVYQSLRPDIGILHESGGRPAAGLAARLIRGWQGLEAERATSQEWQGRLAPAVLIAYGWVFTLVAFDFVMSLDPRWFSTLMGGYYFIGNLFAGLALLAVVASWGRDRLGIQEYVGHHQLHDVGKLLFGFCILWAYMFWSQYLVIWYGDLPEETEFIAHRMDGAWAPLAWTVFAMAFVVPFVVLLSRAIKMHPRGLLTIASVVLVGMWLERFILVSPSLWQGDGVPLGILEILITAGVLGLFAFCYVSFLHAFPVLPVSDPLLAKAADH
ncbi:MAG: molybdopterin oxidoreductase, partial [Alphaproteobacteria bacterium]